MDWVRTWRAAMEDREKRCCYSSTPGRRRDGDKAGTTIATSWFHMLGLRDHKTVCGHRLDM